MIIFILSLLWLFFVFYFLYLVIRPVFYREQIKLDDYETFSDFPTLTVIIPARNEEENIYNCLKGLENQNYPKDKLDIIVINDNSTDKTESIVKEFVSQNDNIQLLNAPELPKGWTGKNHACWISTKKSSADWICFIDADTFAKNSLLKVAMGYAIKQDVDLLSLAPLQVPISSSAKFFLPSIFLAIAAATDFKKIIDPKCDEAIASGPFMLFKRSSYDKIGGHKAIKSIVLEDLEFAKTIKQHGLKLSWPSGEQIVSMSSYKNLPHMWEGFTKGLLVLMGDKNLPSVLLTSFKSFCLGICPFLMPIICYFYMSLLPSTLNQISFYISLSPLLLLLLISLMIDMALKIPLRYCLSFPFGFLLHGILNISSYIKMKKGTRGWKNRTYS